MIIRKVASPKLYAAPILLKVLLLIECELFYTLSITARLYPACTPFRPRPYPVCTHKGTDGVRTPYRHRANAVQTGGLQTASILQVSKSESGSFQHSNAVATGFS
jgi:hypothetical protein